MIEILPNRPHVTSISTKNDELVSEELDTDYKNVLKQVGFEPTAVDTIVERSGLTADAVCSMLLVLELQGYIVSTHGGHYCKISEQPESMKESDRASE